MQNWKNSHPKCKSKPYHAIFGPERDFRYFLSFLQVFFSFCFPFYVLLFWFFFGFVFVCLFLINYMNSWYYEQNIYQKAQDTVNVMDLKNKSLELGYFSNLKKKCQYFILFFPHANTDQLELWLYTCSLFPTLED